MHNRSDPDRTHMERLHLFITARQRSWLRAEAGRLGLPVNELIRRILDSWIARRVKRVGESAHLKIGTP